MLVWQMLFGAFPATDYKAKSKKSQPERSASQIHRGILRLMARSRRTPSDAYSAYAVRSFSTTEVKPVPFNVDHVP